MLDRLLERLALLGGALLTVVAGLVGYEVVVRYAFNAPTTWTLDVSIYLTMWATFLAAGHTLRTGKHVRMDLYVRRLRERVRPAVEWPVAAVALVFCAILAWQGVESVAEAVRLREVTLSAARVPLWIPLSAIPVGAATLVVAWLLCLRDRRIP